MDDMISSVEKLEARIGVAPLPVRMKVIDRIDAAAGDWVRSSPAAFLGMETADGPTISAAGGEPGFARATAKGDLIIPLNAVDAPGALQAGRGFGGLFLIPGVGETLRVNGRVRALTADSVEIAVEECFIHCAKALIRSGFWTARAETAPEGPGAFLAATRFLALATMDREGRVDVSPKGDPAGLLLRTEPGRVLLAERPGNRLAFGYHNIIERPQVAALAIIPGSTTVAVLHGRARLTADEQIRAGFAVEGKAPILATMIEEIAPALGTSAALARAQAWARPHNPLGLDPGATFVTHLKLNKEKGAAATLARLAVNKHLINEGLKSDYKSNLY